MDEQRNPLKGELKFLERLSIEELEALLKFSGDPDDVELLFDTVVEEVVAREKENPTGRLPDVDTAWDELQMMYHNRTVADGEVLLPSLEEEAAAISAGANGSMPLSAAKPKRISFQRVIRTAAAMVAVVILSLALMVGAQAAGVDVFGVLARWTDDTFHFETKPANMDNNITLYETIQTSLNVQESLGKYTPKWYPEGTNVIDVQVFEDNLGISAQISLSDDTGNRFFVSVDQYKQGTYVDPQIFEIEADTVEEYISNGKSYFIFENTEEVTAVWSNGTIVQSIWGKLDTKSIKNMIDSIGD